MHVYSKNVAGGGLLLTTLLVIATLAIGGNASAAEPNIPILPSTTISTGIMGNNVTETKNTTGALDSSGSLWLLGYSPKIANDYASRPNGSKPTPLIQTSIGDYSFASISKNGEISGQLQTTLNYPTICDSEESGGFPAGTYVQAYASEYAIYGLKSSGELYRCMVRKVGETSVQTTKMKLSNIQSVGGAPTPLAVTTDGRVFVWSDANIDGIIQTPVLTEIKFPTGVKIRQTVVGNISIVSHYMVLDESGQAWSWGENESGQLGDGSTTDSDNAPVKVKQPAGVRFTNIAVSNSAASAIDETGQAWAWGTGYLGDGKDFSTSLVPVKVSNPKGVKFTEITGGDNYFTARDSDGNIWTWGGNSLGIGLDKSPVGNGNSIIDPTIPLRAFDFNSDSAEKPSGGTTVISCAPTTGVVPSGLSVFGMVAAGLGLLGVLVVWLRRRFV